MCTDYVFEFISKSSGFIIAAFGFYKAYIEFRDAQKWKKAEFLAKEAKEFFTDKNVVRALKFLDYREHEIPVLDAEISKYKTIKFNQDILLRAWSVDRPIAEFSQEELIIRNITDDFFTKLSYFNTYLDTKLINLEDLRPYFIYWINILGNSKSGKRSKTVMRQLWIYIDYFEYSSIRELVNKFGFLPNFTPTADLPK